MGVLVEPHDHAMLTYDRAQLGFEGGRDGAVGKEGGHVLPVVSCNQAPYRWCPVIIQRCSLRIVAGLGGLGGGELDLCGNPASFVLTSGGNANKQFLIVGFTSHF